MAASDHGRVLTLCLREVGDWTAFLRYLGSDEYAFVGRGGLNDTEARLVLRSTTGAVDFLLHIVSDSSVAHELFLMPARAAQQPFRDMLAAATNGAAASLVSYEEARPLSRGRATLLLSLLRECRTS